MHRLRIGLLFAAALTFGASQVATAQDSTASPTPRELAACSTEPLTYEELASTMATPVAEMADPVASPAAVTAPEGEPADEETTAAVQQTIEQLTACLNEGQLLSTLALYSDNFLQSTFAGLEITEEIFNEELTVVEPRPENARVLVYSFDEVVITEDGRATVVAVGDDLSSESPASATLFYLVQDGDVWKVDETMNNAETES